MERLKQPKVIVLLSILLLIILFWASLVWSISPFTGIAARISCLRPNYSLVTVGANQLPMCVRVYADGGEACQTGADCESGLCVITRETYDDSVKVPLDTTTSDQVTYFSAYEIKQLVGTGTCKSDGTPACYSGSVVVDSDSVVSPLAGAWCD